ncbi:MAG: HDIG domain-containing metalloprotein, partial [Opitutaceae bacterium]
GFTFEAADASFELLLREEMAGKRPSFFAIKNWTTTVVRDSSGEIQTKAEISFSAQGNELTCNGMGNGPVNAFDNALRSGLVKYYPELAELELTDYNHPLLRRMQLEAPGTYHHSLVVAQLAENASNAIGANPLLARVCALFHDIGKTAHLSYFTENQRDRQNPHDEHSPVESAQIIKRHVADGVELALRHGLPRSVIDVIRQHHGTTLVRYFYEQALSHPRSLQPNPSSSLPEAHSISDAAFRYEGPRPQFKESAVISLADGVEAASRSLRAADAGQLTALIEKIVIERIADKQLDEAPLTFEDIARIKNSFQFTLLNMLHARVAYPAAVTETAAKA